MQGDASTGDIQPNPNSSRQGEKSSRMNRESIEAYDLPERVRRYDADMNVMHPLRRKMLEISLEVLPFSAADSFVALDLGVGTGVFTHELLRRFAECSVVAVDGSEGMIDLARTRLSEFEERLAFWCADFRALPTDVLPGDGYDVILSSYALRHLNSADKAKVVARSVEALRPGGWFINADLVRSASEGIENRIQALRVAGVTNRGAGDSRFATPSRTEQTLQELERKERDQPLTAEEDLAILSRSGLTPEILWKEYREVVMAGVKAS